MRDNILPATDPDETTYDLPKFDSFETATTEEFKKIVLESKATTCNLDPMPTKLLKSLIDVFLPILTTKKNI